MVLELVDGGQILDSMPNEDENLSPIFYVPGTEGVYVEEMASVIFRQLLSALVYLERNHIAHRDLKPENVLITKRGVVKLTEFGESTDFNKTATTTRRPDGFVTDTKGTWLFWSPEMCEESVVDDDDETPYSAYAADVWAAGVILYTMMIGELPFWHVEPDQLFESIIKTKTTDLQPPYPTGMSAEYRELLEAMLTPDPSMRPSFEVCESFDWLQKESNVENENKLKDASGILIDRENLEKTLTFTPGNSYFLVPDGNNTTGSFYKNSSSKKLEDGNDCSEKTETDGRIDACPDDHHEQHLKEVKEPPEDVNGHEWKQKYLNKPTWCKICNSFVWGLTAEQQGAYKCKCCKTFGHRHCCIKLNESKCHVRHISRTESQVMAELEDLNGHAWHVKNVKSPRWCKICQSFIYVATEHEQYAYKCANCKTVGHKECCLQRNQNICLPDSGDGRTPVKHRMSFVRRMSGIGGGGGRAQTSPRKDAAEDTDATSSASARTSNSKESTDETSTATGTGTIAATPPSKRRPSFGSGLLQRLSLVTKSVTKPSNSSSSVPPLAPVEKEEKEGKGGDDSSI